ncbi:ovarian cancer-associated gene 2 protein [Nesidiocoris tenuis]|uniref:Ovarian cancer-associated gene 2 protein n=1 Tax=Nesidiocoris tenuis TaxID=355587 RepID=A0ABN7AJN6_9HEMI|nr:ovarian cancer-associated gene 2 protein [Nesidiocoris tenuis]
MRKLKVLCLHGYGQNKEVFRSRLGSLRRSFKSSVDFEFIDAPLVVEPFGEPPPQGDPRAWWHKSDTEGTGIDASIEIVKEAVLNNGPFDGILGFSQGAALLGVISAYINSKAIDFPELKFVILVAGYKYQLKEDYFNEIINIPSFHVIGDTDQIIAKERSELLRQSFKDPQILSHKGGHYVPCSSEFRPCWKEFFDSILCKL